MEFTSEWPRVGGYYWFVDKEYPQPVIGFVQGNTLHRGQTEYRRHDPGTQRFIRFGDAIIAPDCKDCEILD